MATSPDSKIINRESQNKGLVDRYRSKEKAGGAFDAYGANQNNMLKGLGPGTVGSQKSQTLTVEPGFTTNMFNAPRENFKESVLSNDNSTRFKAGFNNQKYTNGRFGR